MFARQQAAAMTDLQAKLKDKGVFVVVIGSGSPEQAKSFVENFAYTGEIYVDEDLDAYNAFELDRGFFKTLGFRSIGKGFTALAQGFRQGLHAGDLWQQGGLFVMGPGNRIVYQHVDRFAGDHADLEQVVKACSAE